MRNKLKIVCTMLAVALTMPLFSGCFSVNSQKMSKLKGTYLLTNYKYTPEYERKEGYTPTTIDYIADRGYETYLVVTGAGEGYYVHKDNETSAYSKEVMLSYEYDEENSSKISYVSYMDSQEELLSSGWNRFGVTRNALNYSLPAFDYTELITKRKMRSKSINKDWKKVDDATDLSYVKEQLGELREYTYEAWAERGLYEMYAYSSVDNTTTLDEEAFPYLYYYVAFDTCAMQATLYYALKADEIPVVTTKNITLSNGWAKIKIGDEEWTKGEWGGNYYQVLEAVSEEEGYRQDINRIQWEYTQAQIDELIATKLTPTQE